MFQQAISPKVSISHDNSNEHSNQHMPMYEQAQNINLDQIFIQPPSGFRRCLHKERPVIFTASR